ncbi:hypothetical protein [Mycolicibacterium sp.]|uniref:hypothetical protein n=1 Tax=Mycolicibacterium sp. TaxID=2320850 RepID=UPI0037CC8CED
MSYDEVARLFEAQKNAAQTYTSQMVYMKRRMFTVDDKLRQRIADEAEREWLRLDAKIRALNVAEYAKVEK